ncbi:MAG: PilW family protein [Thermoleophilia bacterium]
MGSRKDCIIRIRFGSQAGVSLVEMLVTLTLFSIAMAAITSMLLMSMRSQDEINANFRSQQDVRQAVYDMEKNIAEAKRKDASNNQPIFQSDLISIPSQTGTEWITYHYATPSGSTSPTIVRIVTTSRPTIPISIDDADKQMIDVRNRGDLVTAVDRVGDLAPIFKYYGADGSEIASPVVTPRNVRSVKVEFITVVSDGHANSETTTSSTQINLRNF